MTKTYDIDPITDLTQAERSEVLLALDTRAVRVLRDITLAEGLHGTMSEQVRAGWEALGDIVNAYLKVSGDPDFHEAWLDSYSVNERARLMRAWELAKG